MTAPVQSNDIRKFMGRNLVDVFQTMLSMKTVFVGPVGQLPRADRVSGSVGFGGEHVTGAVYVHFSPHFADHVARTMLGLAPESIPGDSEVNDVIGEVTNMLGGGFKSWLCDAGASCAMSTPAIIRGTSFAIEPGHGIERICLSFHCEHEPIIFEVHIRFS